MLTVFAALMLTQSAVEVQVPKSDDPIICTRVRGQHTVGTRLRPKKTCMRKSEWSYVEKNTQRELQQVKDRSLDPGKALGK